ncbi:hypothetical protein GCM10023310_10980 [Paenibacillus vulneris]|uniref:Hydrolase n=1 Tax=Paenibacillus vulneris TaxID=1133364 RepID=A0ABW3UIH7_9BACL|nr:MULTISPECIES: hypothetical protein [unclassified Paenibacillus]MBE1441306.1 hypothetical protein [Paenibacillus sp. OAS669]
MDKRPYYISVQAKTIMLNQGDAPYEFEIMATEEEIDQLYEWFEELDEYEQGTFFRAHVPALPYHHDSYNDACDYTLKQIYRFIADHGSKQTGDHIAAMDLDNMGHWNSK